MLFAQFIGDPPHSSDVASLIAAVLPAVFHRNGIPHNVVVDAFGIEMGADHRLKLPAQQLLRKLQPNLVGQFRRYLSGGEALHQMEALHPFFLMPHFFDSAHILKSGFTGASQSRFKQILLGLIPIEGIVHCSPQGVCVLGTGGFAFIEGIVDGVVQAVDGDYTGISNSVFLLSWVRAA